MVIKRRVALSIGVSEAKPLAYLAAAVNGARAFHAWAQAFGYDARLLTDDEEAVTIARLRRELEAILQPAGTVDRLVLYFAGHGLIREAEEGLWLLSDWHQELRAVAIEALKRRLRKFGVRQVSIFADACRSLPANIDAADLTADAVLGQGPHPSPTNLAVDKFVAAQDGSTTFAVPGPAPEHDRCLFSGVLLEGLWGLKQNAFSKLLKDKITSRSLGAYLEAEVPLRAERYRWKVVPTVVPSFPEGDDIYFGDGPHPAPPVFPDWPPPPAPPEGRAIDAPPIEAATRGLNPAPSGWNPAGTKVPATTRAASGTFGASQRRQPEQSLGSFERRIQEQEVPRSFETGSGFALEDCDGHEHASSGQEFAVRAIWTSPDARAGRSYQRSASGDAPPADWWHVGQRDDSNAGAIQFLARPAPALVECSRGAYLALTALPDFIGSVLFDCRGISALVYRRRGSAEYDIAATARALARLEDGALRAEAKTDLAAALRHGQHVDPILGVISAYLYDSVGDIDSIRRMAAFYAVHQQPIPYDIALLGQLSVHREGNVFVAEVPPVDERKPRTDSETLAPWTYSATQAAHAVVGGLWPWMRQGWAYLDDLNDGSSALVSPALLDVTPHVQSARFTTLDAEGGRRLIELFDLTASSPGHARNAATRP